MSVNFTEESCFRDKKKKKLFIIMVTADDYHNCSTNISLENMRQHFCSTLYNGNSMTISKQQCIKTVVFSFHPGILLCTHNQYIDQRMELHLLLLPHLSIGFYRGCINNFESLVRRFKFLMEHSTKNLTRLGKASWKWLVVVVIYFFT